MVRALRPPTGPSAARLLELLRGRGATLATAESLTGGALAKAITDVPGASAVYLGGAVTYATALKTALLGVSTQLVAEHGVVSAPCAAAMADGIRRATGSSYALSTTGVAGPDLQEGKAVGTVYVGIATPDGTTVLALELAGERAAIRERTCHEAVAALLAALEPHDASGAGGQD